MTLAQDVMTTDVITVTRDQSLAQVRDLFIHKKISGAPVVDEAGELVGVISLYDLLRSESDPAPYHRDGFWLDLSVLEEPLHTVAENLTVADSMSSTSFHVGEMTPLHNVTGLMTLHKLHRIIVTRGRRQVAGVISSLDLVAHLGERLKAGQA